MKLYNIGDVVVMNDWALAYKGQTGTIDHVCNRTTRSFDGFRHCYHVKIGNEIVHKVPAVAFTLEIVHHCQELVDQHA